MFGALVGDIIGSHFEFNNTKSKDFPLFNEDTRFTDDSVLTLAISKYFLTFLKETNKDELIKLVKETAQKYINAGYGPSFLRWINSNSSLPYNSYGNGAAMRVSPVAYVSNSLEETIKLSDFITSITHNHEEGLKGARCIATSIYLLLHGATKSEVKEYVEKNYYQLNFNYEDLVKNYKFEISCQKSVPQAIYIFLISKNYIDALRNAISIGGDSDTISDMVLALSEAYYLNKNNKEGYKVTNSLPETKKNEILYINSNSLNYLTKDLREICKVFNKKYGLSIDQKYINYPSK